MSEFDRRVTDLLEKAAGPARPGPYDVDAVLAAATRSRRRRRWTISAASLSAAAVSAVVLTSLLVVNSTSEPSRTESVPAVPAAALAGGHWIDIPAAPFQLCNVVQTAWTGHQLLVIQPENVDGQHRCPRAAATLDPATRRWRSIAPPPAGVRGAVVSVWTGSELLVVEPESGFAATWTPADDHWKTAASLPPTARGGALAMWRGHPVAAGVGAHGTQVQRFVDNHWQALAPLPAPAGATVPRASAAQAGDDLYVNYTLAQRLPPNGSSEYASTVVYHDGHWTPLHGIGGNSSQGSELDPAHAWFKSNGCLWANTCMPQQNRPSVLVLPADGTYRDPGRPPLPAQAQAAVVVLSRYGAAAYDTGGGSINGIRDAGGDIALYDLASQRWRTGPSAPRTVTNIHAFAWTPRAFILLATAASGSGLELVPSDPSEPSG